MVVFLFGSETLSELCTDTPLVTSFDGDMEERNRNLPPPPPEPDHAHKFEISQHGQIQNNSIAGESHKIQANEPPKNAIPNSVQCPLLLSPSSSETFVAVKTESGAPKDSNSVATAMTAAELGTDLDIGSKVEVVGNLPNCKYGVVRWMGRDNQKNKPIAGLEMVRLSLD